MDPKIPTIIASVETLEKPFFLKCSATVPYNNYYYFLYFIKVISSGMKTWYISKRSIFTILGFFGVLTFYGTRVNMSIAMVAMVNHTKDDSLDEAYQNAACQNLIRNETKENEVHFTGTNYNWDPETQGFILSSFYYGYVATQLPGGILCERLGSKWLFGGGILITTSLYLFVPLAASWGVTAVAAIRILEGLGE
ncbi:hypothetical protein NPIL_404481, partial [Nephila pilipes]